MFDSLVSFSDFKNTINLSGSEYNIVSPINGSYLKFSKNPSGEIPRIKNGIIDSDLFLKEKDLNHTHQYIEKVITSGGMLASGTNSTITSSASSTIGPEPKISIGSKNPLTVDRLLNTLEVFGIVFSKNIER